MRLLLDTNVFLRWCQDSPRLTKPVRARIAAANEVYVSSVSIWECAIKIGIGKLEADMALLVESIAASGFAELPLVARHAAALASLPEIHRDPFDRMLIAQALSEPLRFLTSDDLLCQYSELVDLI